MIKINWLSLVPNLLVCDPFSLFFKEKDKGDSKLNSVDAQTVSSSIHVLIKAGFVKQQQPWQQDDNDDIVLDFEALVYHSFSQMNNWQLVMKDLEKGVHLTHVSSKYTYKPTQHTTFFFKDLSCRYAP